jgi:hypothetical protein
MPLNFSPTASWAVSSWFTSARGGVIRPLRPIALAVATTVCQHELTVFDEGPCPPLDTLIISGASRRAAAPAPPAAVMHQPIYDVYMFE